MSLKSIVAAAMLGLPFAAAAQDEKKEPPKYGLDGARKIVRQFDIDQESGQPVFEDKTKDGKYDGTMTLYLCDSEDADDKPDVFHMVVTPGVLPFEKQEVVIRDLDADGTADRFYVLKDGKAEAEQDLGKIPKEQRTIEFIKGQTEKQFGDTFRPYFSQDRLADLLGKSYGDDARKGVAEYFGKNREAWLAGAADVKLPGGTLEDALAALLDTKNAPHRDLFPSRESVKDNQGAIRPGQPVTIYRVQANELGELTVTEVYRAEQGVAGEWKKVELK
jgi:hypothetical protein